MTDNKSSPTLEISETKIVAPELGDVEEGPSTEKHLLEEIDPLEVVLIHVGEMGLYQKFLFMVTLPFGFFFAFVYFGQMFITATPTKHWCRTPELSKLTQDLRRNLTAPGTAEHWDRCRSFQTDWSKVLETFVPPHPDTPTEPCKHGWEFELSDIPYQTVVSERGWVCDKANKVPLAQSIFFLGAVCGGFFFGWLADHKGRIPALVGANLIGCLGGVATTFTKGFWDFAVCRFLVGCAHDNCYILIYILVLEYVGPHHRTWVANMSMALFFGSGCVAVPWVALLADDWRRFAWGTSLPLLFVITTPFFVPESARWMASKGYTKRAVDVLKKFERVNKTHIPQQALDDFIKDCEQTIECETLLDLMHSTLLRTCMIVMLLTYMGISIVFDGLVRMSENLGMDFFITFTLSSVTEIPSTVLLAVLLDRGGRRALTCGPLVLTGFLALVAAFVPKGIPQATLCILARFCVSMSYSAAVQWATELLPTGVRASGSAIVHVSGYIASIMSPFVVFSERAWTPLPLVIMGIVSLMSAALGILLPETSGQHMPQDIADGEKLILEYSYLKYYAQRMVAAKNKLTSKIAQSTLKLSTLKLSTLKLSTKQTNK